MSIQWNQKKFNEVVAEVQKRSVTDPEFRALALSDSSAAVAAVVGESLPAGAKLRFVDRLEEVVIVLPPSSSAELTEEQLENVAGGAVFFGGLAIASAVDNCY